MLPLTDRLQPPVTGGSLPGPSPLALLCLSQDWGTAEQHSAGLAGQLNRPDRPVTLVVAAGGPLHEHARTRGLRCIPLPNAPWGGDAQRGAELVSWLRREGIRLLVTTRSADLGLAALLRLARPSLRLVHRQLEPLGLQPGVGRWRWWQRRQLRLVDAWVAPLPWMASQLRTDAGLDLRRLWVVAPPLPVADSSAGPDCPARQARRLLDLPQDAPLIGVLDYGSARTEFALEVLHRLVAEHGSGAELVVMNGRAAWPDPARWDLLKELAQELGLSQRVHLRPLHSVPAPGLFYAALDVLLVPDAQAAAYAPLLEALARGCPLVSADTADAVDLLPGLGSRCFPTQNVEACAGALLAALQPQAPAPARAMSNQATARVLQRRLLAEGARQLEAILDYLAPVAAAAGGTTS